MVRRALTGFFAAAVFSLFTLPGCSAYVPNYSYTPRPALVVISAQGELAASSQPAAPQAPALQVYATVVGILRADGPRPESVEVRLRLENGNAPVTFDPRAMEVITGGLVVLGKPQPIPDQPIELAPGQATSIAAVFPFPPGISDSTVDLTGLRLRIPLAIAGRRVEANANFQRLIPVYYDPYPDPSFYGPYPRYWGGVYYHRHWR